jgi:predicted phosphodiesterase
MKDVELVKRLYIENIQDKSVVSWQEIADEYNRIKGTNLKPNGIRHYLDGVDKEQLKKMKITDESTHYSERYIETGTSERLSDEDIILRHGLDPQYWEVSTLGSTRSKIGTSADEGHFINTYQKAQFKPRVFKLDEKTISELCKRETPKVIIEKQTSRKSYCLEIQLADLHFGVNSFEYYRRYLEKIVEIVHLGWDTIIITTGGDMIHVDDFKGRTFNDTLVGSKEMLLNAYDWCMAFYETLIEECIAHSNKTKLIYVVGNHDTTVSWLIAKKWEDKYPQCEHDTSLEQWKWFKYGKNFIGLTHGDKGKFKNFAQVFNALFRQEMADCTNIEVHSQDKHHEKALSEYGITTRIITSPSQMTDYIKENGFVGNRKAIELFAYDEKNLQAHYYIEP